MNLRSASGNWARFGIADAAGVSFRLVHRPVLQPAAGGTRPCPGTAFDWLTQEAADVEAGSDGLLFFPYLLGERTLGTERSRASFIGATLSHQRPSFRPGRARGDNAGGPQVARVRLPRRFRRAGALYRRRRDEQLVEPDPGGRVRPPGPDADGHGRRHPGGCHPGRRGGRLVRGRRCGRRGRSSGRPDLAPGTRQRPEFTTMCTATFCAVHDAAWPPVGALGRRLAPSEPGAPWPR